MKRFLQARFLLPAIFFILLTAIVFLILKNNPWGNGALLTPTPVTLVQASQIATTPTLHSTLLPTENPQIVFGLLPFKIYYSQNGELWLWHFGTAKSISEIDTATPLLANEQNGQVLFTLHGDLWQVDPLSLTPKVLVSANVAQQGTPTPTSVNEILTAAGIIPGSNGILFSTLPGAGVSMAQANGSSVTRLLIPGEDGALYPSSDGKWLAVVNSSSIRLLSFSNRTIPDVLDFVPIPTSNGILLPVPHWAEDSTRFVVAIPPADFSNDLNAPTGVWQVNTDGQKVALASIQSRGGKMLFSADLQSVIYQLNLSSVSDYFGELHRANTDGSRDAILFGGQLAHLIELDANGTQAVFQFQDSPNSIRMEDSSTAQNHSILDGLDADTVLTMIWMDDQTFLYQTSQAGTVRLWMARFDGKVHPSLLLAENDSGNEILFCFIPK